MPFLTRNENQSQVRYAAPARPMIPTTGDASATTPAPATVTAAKVPFRLATALLRWTSEEDISTQAAPWDATCQTAWLSGHDRRVGLNTVRSPACNSWTIQVITGSRHGPGPAGSKRNRS